MKRGSILQKAAAAALAAVMAGSPVAAMADTYTAPGEGNVTCLVTIGEEFTVTLPASIYLVNNQAVSLPVSVQGDLTAGQTVEVVPAATVSMEYVTDNETYKKKSVVADVTAGKTAWTYEELFAGDAVKDTATTVTVCGLTAGSWVGSLTYDISLTDANEENEEDSDVDAGERPWEKVTGYETETSDDGKSYLACEDGVYIVHATDVKNIQDLAENYASITVNGETVTSDKLYYNVTLADSVTVLEDYAFSNAYYAEDYSDAQIDAGHIISVGLNWDNEVTSIGSYAFQGTSISSMSIPDSVETVGAAPFDGCRYLTYMNIIGSVGTDRGPSMTGKSFIESVVGLGATISFSNDEVYYSIDKLMYADQSVCIKNVAAANNGEIRQQLDNATIPSTIASPVGTGTFSVRYFDIAISDEVTALDDYAFAYGEDAGDAYGDYRDSSYEYRIYSVSLPGALTEIGKGAFKGQCWLKKAPSLPDTLSKIGEYAFYKMGESNKTSDIGYLRIPDSVTSIGQYAFSHVGNVKSVTIESGGVDIGMAAFGNMSNLESLTFTKKNCVLGYTGASGELNKSNCLGAICAQDPKLSSISLPTAVTAIYSKVFDGNSKLFFIIIPNGVTEIASDAFSGSSLQSIFYSGDATDTEGNHWGAPDAKIYANNTL